MVGIADQAARGVSVLGQQSQEATGDLPVPSGDEDVHGLEATPRAFCEVAARTEAVSDPVNVLDVDTALADLIPSEQRAQARQATGAATIEFDVGSWSEPVDSDQFRGGYGLLVFEGLMLRRAGIEGRHAAELLGPGDLLRPWQHDGGDSTLEVDWAFRVVAPSRVAVLDPRWTARAVGLAAARRRARGTGAEALAAARDRDGDRAAAAARRAPVDALLGPRGPLRQGPRRRRAPRPAADARGAQPPRGRAPPVGLGRAHAAGRRGPPAPLRPPLGAAGDPPPLDHSLTPNGARSPSAR